MQCSSTETVQIKLEKRTYLPAVHVQRLICLHSFQLEVSTFFSIKRTSILLLSLSIFTMPNKVKTIANTNLYTNLTVFKFPVQTDLPLSRIESRRRVVDLYKSWYRQLPSLVHDYKLNVTAEEARSKLRETFARNSGLTNLGQIHSLVMHGQIELNELMLNFKEPCHFYKYFRTTSQRKPDDFLSKFLQEN